MAIKRVIVVILDSVGIGEAPDAAEYGDVGSHTLGNMARAVGGLQVPHLEQMGLGNIAVLQGVVPQTAPTAVYGRLRPFAGSIRRQRHYYRSLGIDGHRASPGISPVSAGVPTRRYE